MTIEQKIMNIFNKFFGKNIIADISKWEVGTQVPTTCFPTVDLQKNLNEVWDHYFDRANFLRATLEVEHLIYDEDPIHCLTSNSEYVRMCKKWMMKNKYSKRKATRKINKLIKKYEMGPVLK